MNNPVADSPIKRSLVTLRGALLFFGLFATTILSAQGWELTFGGNNFDEGMSVLQTSDQGYLLVGFTESFSTSGVNDGDEDIYVVRTDVDGTVLWSNVYDEAYIEYGYKVIETEDKGFLIVGEITAALGQLKDIYLLKISETGGFEWSRTYGTITKTEQANDVVKVAGGGYAIIGQSKTPSTNDGNIELLRVDNAGNLIWSKSYDHSGYDDRGNAIVALPDGGFAFAGSTKDGAGFDTDMVVFRVDANGEVLWDDAFGFDDESEEVNDLLFSRDGVGLILVGSISSENVGYLRRYNLTETGAELDWVEHVTPGLLNAFYSATELSDGSIVATGFTQPDNIIINVLVAKVSATGEAMWVRALGAPDKAYFGYGITATQDGGFIISGSKDAVTVPDAVLIKLDEFGNISTNEINGQVYRSTDGECDEPEEGEDVPLKNWTITAESADKTYVTLTDDEGRYSIQVETGVYTVKVLPANSYWQVCNPDGIQADLSIGYDTVSVNFPVTAITGCAQLNVGISSDFLAVCEEVGYTVSYWNAGTIVAPNAYVEVTLDEELTYVSSTVAPSAVNDHVYTFQLGDLASMQYGDFRIITQMACSGIAQGQAALVSAHIYPDTICLEPDPNWDMSSIIVGGTCENDSIKFFIRNVGTGNMLQQRTYIIIEDDVVMLNQPFQLPTTEEKLISIDGSVEGSTYRLIAQQSNGHPGASFPTVAIEGCAEGDYTTGFVTDFPEDEGDPFIAIDVQEVSGSGLPIALRGHPTGYRDSVLAQNTDITYTVVFRNVGTDTISRVVIRDTLPAGLDFTKVTLGPSSHPYNAQLYGNGILKITFDEIQLQPNGSAQEAQTRGFVKFRIAQKPDLPLETIIDNRAAVYFDYVEPAVTNEVHYVIGCTNLFQEDCIAVNIEPDPDPQAGTKIKINPNPFATVTTITIDGPVTGKTFNFEVYDITGKLVRSNRFTENHFDFHRGGLAPGMYLYRIQSEGHLFGSGKILVQ